MTRKIPPFEPEVSEKALRDRSNKNCITKKIKTLMFALSMTVLATAALGIWIFRQMDRPVDTGQIFYPIDDSRQNPQDKDAKVAVETVEAQVTEKAFGFTQTALHINSRPEKAQVFLNGELKGTTPLTTIVAEGMHQIRLSLEGYHDWDSNLFIEEAGELQVQIPMLKQKRGDLTSSTSES